MSKTQKLIFWDLENAKSWFFWDLENTKSWFFEMWKTQKVDFLRCRKRKKLIFWDLKTQKTDFLRFGKRKKLIFWDLENTISWFSRFGKRKKNWFLRCRKRKKLIFWDFENAKSWFFKIVKTTKKAQKRQKWNFQVTRHLKNQLFAFSKSQKINFLRFPNLKKSTFCVFQISKNQLFAFSKSQKINFLRFSKIAKRNKKQHLFDVLAFFSFFDVVFVQKNKLFLKNDVFAHLWRMIFCFSMFSRLQKIDFLGFPNTGKWIFPVFWNSKKPVFLICGGAAFPKNTLFSNLIEKASTDPKRPTYYIQCSSELTNT